MVDMLGERVGLITTTTIAATTIDGGMDSRMAEKQRLLRMMPRKGQRMLTKRHRRIGKGKGNNRLGVWVAWAYDLLRCVISRLLTWEMRGVGTGLIFRLLLLPWGFR
jgi:hypothetical protein